MGRPVLTEYARNNGLRILYGTHLQTVNDAGQPVGGTQAELDALLVSGTIVAQVVSAKLDDAQALTGETSPLSTELSICTSTPASYT